jgi:hypothetical protein
MNANFRKLCVLALLAVLQCTGTPKDRPSPFLGGNMAALGRGGAVTEKTRYFVYFIVPSQGCPCSWMPSVSRAVQLAREQKIPCDFTILVDGAIGSSIRSEVGGLLSRDVHLVGRSEGKFLEALGLDPSDLPYWLVFDGERKYVILSGRLSPVLSEQKLQVDSLLVLHSFSGEGQ